MSSRLIERIRRVALSVPAFVQHVPKLTQEVDGLKGHVRRLETLRLELEAHVAELIVERDSLRGHIERLEKPLRLLSAPSGPARRGSISGFASTDLCPTTTRCTVRCSPIFPT